MSKKQRPLTMKEIILRRKSEVYVNMGYRSLFLRIILLILLCWFIFAYIFLITQANGNDMFPAIKDGDLILAFRLQNEYSKNDVIVYEMDDTLHVGRIVARENDVVMLDENGTLLVNGTIQNGEIMYPTYSKDGLTYPYVVPENHFFVLGDYRTQSTDSRDSGPVPLENVQAKVITLIRRRGI